MARITDYVGEYPSRLCVCSQHFLIELHEKYSADVAWETEVWLANEPEHMIHFNGDRFLDPIKHIIYLFSRLWCAIFEKNHRCT